MRTMNTRCESRWKTALKRKNRLSAVSTDQAGRTVARPHHSWNCKEKPGPSQSFTDKP